MHNKKLKKGKKGRFGPESKEELGSADVGMNRSTGNDRKRAKRTWGKTLGKNSMNPNWRELNV